MKRLANHLAISQKPNKNKHKALTALGRGKPRPCYWRYVCLERFEQRCIGIEIGEENYVS